MNYVLSYVSLEWKRELGNYAVFRMSWSLNSRLIGPELCRVVHPDFENTTFWALG